MFERAWRQRATRLYSSLPLPNFAQICRMQLQQSANGQDVTAKGVGHFASTKEEIKLPKRTDAIFDEFGTVLAKSHLTSQIIYLKDSTVI